MGKSFKDDPWHDPEEMNDLEDRKARRHKRELPADPERSWVDVDDSIKAK